MRRTIGAGLLLAAAAPVTVLVGAGLELELESVALAGLASGAVLALTPDATPGRRVAAYLLGVSGALVSYFVRAALLPDTASGRAVAIGLALLLCVGVAALSTGRLPLWSLLVGSASFAGAFELSYAQAPPLVAGTSLSALSALLVCVGAGFVATFWASQDHTPAATLEVAQ